jgi:diadenosine tetraphosphate (Ap4A) HIT family hydrolase
MSFNQKDTKKTVCTFCDEKNLEKAIRQTDTVYVIPNRVKYDMFEGRRVLDHLLVVPKKHRESVSSFTAQEQQDIMGIIGDYEAQGYHFFGRGKQTITRSVTHQHTHLVKVENKWPFIFVYLHKVNWLFSK